MTSICRICLRSDLLLQTPNDDLEQFYDELCECYGEISIKFCGECLYSVKKCYRFKQRCQLAVKILKTWKKKKRCDKKSIKFLYTEMPKSQLSLCNKNNFKVYFYQAPDVNTAAPIQISNCRHPHVVTVNIPPSEYTEDVQIEPPIEPEESEMSEDEIYILKVDPNFDQNDMENKMDFTDLHSTEFNGNISENETNADSKVEEDSDTSLDELLSDIQTKSLLEDKKVQKPTKDSKDKVREKFRKLLQNKFEISGDVKDDKGNAIDMDLVLSYLDQTPLNTVIIITNMLCSGPGPFTPLAISKLSEIQNRFIKYESVFTITYLKDESQIMEEFEKRRQYRDYTSFEHRCEKCIRPFKSSKALETHIRTFHDESLMFVCQYCQVRCENKKTLTKHIGSHSIVFKCKLCDFVTHHSTASRRHYNIHKGIKYQCKYKHCQIYFGSESRLYHHYNVVHSDQHNLICEFCAQTFNNKKRLISHKHRKHRGEEFVQSELNKKCDVCDVTFINDDVYRKHLGVTHKVEGMGIQRRRRNINRVKDPTVRKKRKTSNYVCRVCNVLGHSLGWLLGHFMREHPNEDMEKIYSSDKKYLCQDCGKRFSNLTYLRDHKNMHTGVKPFSCDKCPAKFRSRMHLTLHLHRHLPPSKECQHCGKKFVSASNLNNHMRTHIGDRRYKCDICGKGFLHRHSLNEHVRGVHLHIRRVKKKPVKTDVE